MKIDDENEVDYIAAMAVVTEDDKTTVGGDITDDSAVESTDEDDDKLFGVFTNPNPYARPIPKLLEEAKINVGSDILASGTTRVAIDQGDIPPMPPVLKSPYPGSRAMLRIRGKWITSKIKKNLCTVRRKGPA